jgi:hypothetical protein
MAQAATLRLAYLASKHRLAEHEVCRVLRDARTAHRVRQPIILATVERVVRIVVAARARTAA